MIFIIFNGFLGVNSFLIKPGLIKKGTNTYFHDIKSYEERLDSEHVQERKIIKIRDKSGETAVQRFLNQDP